MAKVGQAFDFHLFKRLLRFTKPYKITFWFVGVSAILVSGFSVLQPILLESIIDDSIIPQDYENLLFYITLMVAFLIAEVFFQFSFIYYSNWLGFNVVRDIRVKLFDKILNFKMKYFDKSSVGRLTTRAV